MAQSVQVNFDYMPAGELVGVDGVGMVPNGSTVTVEDWQVLAWENMTGHTWPVSGVLVLPAPVGDPNPNDAQSAGALEAAIIDRQDARSPEEMQTESDAATLHAIKGNVRPDGEIMVDGEVIDVTATVDDLVQAPAPVVAPPVFTPPPTTESENA